MQKYPRRHVTYFKERIITKPSQFDAFYDCDDENDENNGKNENNDNPLGCGDFLNKWGTKIKKGKYVIIIHTL